MANSQASDSEVTFQPEGKGEINLARKNPKSAQEKAKPHVSRREGKTPSDSTGGQEPQSAAGNAEAQVSRSEGITQAILHFTLCNDLFSHREGSTKRRAPCAVFFFFRLLPFVFSLFFLLFSPRVEVEGVRAIKWEIL